MLGSGAPRQAVIRIDSKTTVRFCSSASGCKDTDGINTAFSSWFVKIVERIIAKSRIRYVVTKDRL